MAKDVCWKFFEDGIRNLASLQVSKSNAVCGFGKLLFYWRIIDQYLQFNCICIALFIILIIRFQALDNCVCLIYIHYLWQSNI